MGSAAREYNRISRLFAFASGNANLQPEVILDNQRVDKLAKKGDSRNRTKNIDFKFHSVPDIMKRGSNWNIVLQTTWSRTNLLKPLESFCFETISAPLN